MHSEGEMPESAIDWSDERANAIQSFAESKVFIGLFETGMSLVEETASYLDGQGREDSRALPRNVALAYAGESMRLTTRLMQVASWLLVHRAVREGELTSFEASDEKYRLGETDVCRGNAIDGAHLLPDALLDLMARSERLYDRVERLDRSLFLEPIAPEEAAKPVLEHHRRLEAAFGARR